MWDPRANPLISNQGARPGISGAVFGGKVIWEEKWDVRTGTLCFNRNPLKLLEGYINKG
jgi:hypothetical protein